MVWDVQPRILETKNSFDGGIIWNYLKTYLLKVLQVVKYVVEYLKVDQLLQKCQMSMQLHLLVFLPQVFLKIVSDCQFLITLVAFISIFNFPSLEWCSSRPLLIGWTQMIFVKTFYLIGQQRQSCNTLSMRIKTICFLILPFSD